MLSRMVAPPRGRMALAGRRTAPRRDQIGTDAAAGSFRAILACGAGSDDLVDVTTADALEE